MRRLVPLTFLAAVLAIGGAVIAQTNAGADKPEASLPFNMTPVASFNLPWRIAFISDGRMLITEKDGPLWLVTQKGEKTSVTGVPATTRTGAGDQGGMLGVYAGPTYAADQAIYLTYSEPGEGGTGLALAKAKLVIQGTTARLDGLKVIWRQLPRGAGGQLGGAVAFSPDGKYLFLTVGDRQRFTPAQDPNQALGKILRLTLDGAPAPGNPNAGKTGPTTVSLIRPPSDTEAAATAPATQVTLPGPNLAPSEIWATGFRTPYGLTFGPDGKLWEVEHGPRGGDELNLVETGKNYGWPLVSYGNNYNGKPIPKPDTRPDLTKPVIYWDPVIAPGNFTFYNGSLFPAWKGSGFVSGLASQSLTRIVFDGKGGAKTAERWAMGHKIRDVANGPDGALWLLEDANPGQLYRLTPK